MNQSAVIELVNATKVYPGDVRAVDDVSLRIESGTVMALLGTSGCGKTTTLRLINRLEEPTGGRVMVRGRDVREQRQEQLRRSIGYVIQEGGLFPHMTVVANIQTVPSLLGWDRRRIRTRVAEVLELVGLPESEYGRRMPSELSGGQRQRVGVARAIAADPDILLMDEPFGALDPGTRENLQDEFRSWQAQLRKTVVLVTHDITEASLLANSIVLMDRGQVVQQGTVQDLLLKPAGERVRSFLGRQRQSLALSAFRLVDVVNGLAPGASGAERVRLRGDLPIGQVLAAVAGAGACAVVEFEGEPGRCYPADAIRNRVWQILGATT